MEARLTKLGDVVRTAFLTPEEKRTGAQRELVLDMGRRLVVSESELAGALPEKDRAERGRLLQELKRFEGSKPPPTPKAIGLSESGRSAATFVLLRGELQNAADAVTPGWPSILTPSNREEPADVASRGKRSTGRRLALAECGVLHGGHAQRREARRRRARGRLADRHSRSG